MFGGYFETWRLLDTVHDATLKVEYTTSADQLAERVSKGRSDALVIEPVAYDWDMAVFDRDGLAGAWRGAGDASPRLVIVDTSLTAHRFTLDDLLPVFGEYPPLMVAFVRSGLKLDQQGLELSNVGIVHIYVPEKEDRPVHLERLRQRLTVNRAITGGALTINQAAALEVPWFLDSRSLTAHADRIFENNRALARQVKLDGGIFSCVNHPALTPGEDRKWAEAPFVVFHLEESTASRLGMLVAILVHEARARGLCLDLASSFGFRGHRLEVIQPLMQIREVGAAKGLLKVAMGSRNGPSREGVISLINEIAAYRDWDSLIAAYRDVRAYAKSSFGVYQERPPRL